MRTSKSISSIAYHRPEEFKKRVDSLRLSGVIGPCLWISHKAGDKHGKPHIHLLLLGTKVYQTDGLSSIFSFDIIDGEKASVTDHWRPTKSISDWILYGIHEATYLARKGQFGKEAYSWDDINCTPGDEDLLEELKDEAREVLEAGENKIYRILKHAVKQGWTWQQTIVSGLLPIATLRNSYEVFQAFQEQEGKPEALQAAGAPPRPPERPSNAQAVLAVGRPPGM